MLKKFTLNLDIEQQTTNQVFYVNSLDSNSVQLTINVLESAVAKNITGISPTLDIMNPDGSMVSQNCTISNSVNGVVTVLLPSSATSLIGVHQGLLKLTDVDASVVVTNSFQYIVKQGY